MEVSKANINLIDSYKQAKERIRQLEAEVVELKDRLSSYEGEDVVAKVIWTVEDIAYVIDCLGYEVTDELLGKVVPRVKDILSDYGEGWELIEEAVHDCVNN